MSKSKKMKKTNAMRILDQEGIAYEMHTYEASDGHIDGMSVAQKTGQNPDQVFKTLVTVGHSKEHYVFVIPVQKELNLKDAAKAVCEKKIELIQVKELLPLTGYVRGGCSPIGMKKEWITVIDEAALQLPFVLISGGKIGMQIQIKPEDLIRVVKAKVMVVSQ